jgi:hypothetical protein
MIRKCDAEPPEISYISETLANAYVLYIIYGLIQKLLDKNKNKLLYFYCYRVFRSC